MRQGSGVRSEAAPGATLLSVTKPLLLLPDCAHERSHHTSFNTSFTLTVSSLSIPTPPLPKQSHLVVSYAIALCPQYAETASEESG
eukprot:2751407-Rhodomonas_salina.1